MSEKYKTDSDGLYFVSYSVVGWMDVFTRREYQEILIDSIKYCQDKKNLKIYSYCIMHNPVEVGFANQPQEWRMSSANENGPIKLNERI